MEQILEFLKPELLVLVPTCWGIGMVLKASAINNQRIPLVLALSAIALATVWVLATMTYAGWQSALLAAFAAVTQGVLAWLVAWVTYEKGVKALQKAGGDNG